MVFDEDTPAEIIKAVQPDILVKGADWAEDAIVGRDTVESRGGQVAAFRSSRGDNDRNYSDSGASVRLSQSQIPNSKRFFGV